MQRAYFLLLVISSWIHETHVTHTSLLFCFVSNFVFLSPAYASAVTWGIKVPVLVLIKPLKTYLCSSEVLIYKAFPWKKSLRAFEWIRCYAMPLPSFCMHGSVNDTRQIWHVTGTFIVVSKVLRLNHAGWFQSSIQYLISLLTGKDTYHHRRHLCRLLSTCVKQLGKCFHNSLSNHGQVQQVHSQTLYSLTAVLRTYQRSIFFS